MFNIENAKEFYDPTVPKNHRKDWYLFVYKFLICVNGDLLKSIQGSKVREQKNIFQYISVSDEAFTRWVIEVKYKKVKYEVENPDIVKMKNFKKPPGQHASSIYSSRYALIHAEVLKGRKKTRNDWNDVFWNYYKVFHPELFQERSIITQTNITRQHLDEIPLEDDDQLVQVTTITNNSNPVASLTEEELQSIINREDV
jgi:hypothetical protein